MLKFVFLNVLVILLSDMSVTVFGKVCSKNVVITYKVVKFDPVNLKPREEIQSKSTFMFVCCEGYREVSRTRHQPICEPVCKLPCGHGYCYSPNKCICDPGYMLTKKTCKAIPTTVATSTEILPALPEITMEHIVTNGTFKTIQTTATTSTEPEPVIPTIAVPIVVPSIYLQPDNIRDIPGAPQCGKCSLGTCLLGTCKCPTGYQLTLDGDCQPICGRCTHGRCTAPNHCECLPEYSYDSETRECKPLCNGKIYGCIRGTCVGYNQCRCDNGTMLQDNERFTCKSNEPLRRDPIFDCLWLALIPLFLAIAGIGIIIIVWKKKSSNYLASQGDSFPEVRYGNPESEHSTVTKFHDCYSEETLPMNGAGASTSRGTIRRNGNVVVIGI